MVMKTIPSNHGIVDEKTRSSFSDKSYSLTLDDQSQYCSIPLPNSISLNTVDEVSKMKERDSENERYCDVS